MKKILITFCVLAFMASMAQATESRLESMGMGNFWVDGYYYNSYNSIIKDDANIGLYPSTINYYPNIFWGEVQYNDAIEWSTKSWWGNNDYFYKAGALFQIGEDNPWVLGAHFSTVPYGSYYFDLDNYDDWTGGTNHKLNLYYGRNLSDMPFGFTFGYYNSSYDMTENDDSSYYYGYNYEYKFNRMEFGFGLSPMEGKLDLALGFGLDSWTDKHWDDSYSDGAGGYDSGLVEQTKPDGNFDFSFRGRYWMDPNGKFQHVPHVTFMSSKRGEEYYTDYTRTGETYAAWQLYYTYKYTETIFDFGWGVNYDASEDVLVAADFGIALGSMKWETDYADTSNTDSEYKEKMNAMPYFRMGLDAKIFKWLDFRAGVMSMWNGYKEEESYTDTDDPTDYDAYDYEYNEKFSTTTTFLGVGMHWGDLEIDAVMDPEFLLNGPDFIGGGTPDYYYYKDGEKAPGSPYYHLFTKVSLKYSF
ncbi:MAG: hypothetical protein ABIJ45_12295 [Candidatus Zixiibacteriota bacterium]